MASPKLTVEITLGNVLSMASTLAAAAGCIWYFSASVQDARNRDVLHDIRLDKLEAEITRNRADHDLLIEIRQDLKMLRSQWESQPRIQPPRVP